MLIYHPTILIRTSVRNNGHIGEEKLPNVTSRGLVSNINLHLYTSLQAGSKTSTEFNIPQRNLFWSDNVSDQKEASLFRVSDADSVWLVCNSRSRKRLLESNKVSSKSQFLFFFFFKLMVEGGFHIVLTSGKQEKLLCDGSSVLSN